MAVEKKRVSGKKEVQAATIFDAAAQMFAKKGYHSTTMEEISMKAQISKPTLYKRFKSKELLMEQVIEGILDDVDGFVKESVSYGATPLEKVKHFVKLDLDYFTKYPEKFILILTERKLLHPDEFQEYHRVLLEKYLKHIHLIGKELILPGIRAGQFKNLGTQKMAFFLSGLVISAVWRNLFSEFLGLSSDSRSREVDSIITIFFNGVTKNQFKGMN